MFLKETIEISYKTNIVYIFPGLGSQSLCTPPPPPPPPKNE